MLAVSSHLMMLVHTKLMTNSGCTTYDQKGRLRRVFLDVQGGSMPLKKLLIRLF